MRALWICACLMALVIWGSTAWAEVEFVERAGQNAPDGLSNGASALTEAFSPEMASAQEKGIAVIEARPFAKAGRGEISLGLGTIASDIFLVYLPVTIRGGYHFREWVSLELSASYMGCFGDETGANQLRASGQKCMRFVTPGYDRLMSDSSDRAQIRSVTIQEYAVARFSIDSTFSFLMGKFSLGQAAIGHFDLYAAAGLGAVVQERPDDVVAGKMHYGASVEGNFGIGLRFVFWDFVGVRMDFREYLFGHVLDKGLGTASELTLGVFFLFPGRAE